VCVGKVTEAASLTIVQVETLSSTKVNNGSHCSSVMQSNTSLSKINTKLGEQCAKTNQAEALQK